MIMDIHPIRTESDYLAALETIKPYFENEPDPASEVGERFEVILALIHAYEIRQHPMDAPDSTKANGFHLRAITEKNSELKALLNELRDRHTSITRHIYQQSIWLFLRLLAV